MGTKDFFSEYSGLIIGIVIFIVVASLIYFGARYLLKPKEPYIKTNHTNPFHSERFENNNYAPLTKSWSEKKTLDRLDRIDSDLLPNVSSNVTPYDVDVADPISYSFQVHAPRVIRKDLLQQQADPFRGDIPIVMYPDVPIIQRSRYNRDSLRLDGMFSEALAKSYDRLTGKAFFDTPTQVSHGGTITDVRS
uniref:Uncharacterized protein n=1 Tax=viral metagenome TaxID=1070528 RepID=A0A6C0JVD0_9ZZZZ